MERTTGLNTYGSLGDSSSQRDTQFKDREELYAELRSRGSLPGVPSLNNPCWPFPQRELFLHEALSALIYLTKICY